MNRSSWPHSVITFCHARNEKKIAEKKSSAEVEERSSHIYGEIDLNTIHHSQEMNGERKKTFLPGISELHFANILCLRLHT